METLNCTDCKLHEGCRSAGIQGVGKSEVKLMIVLDGPSKTDDEFGTVAKGGNFDLLHKVLTDVLGIDMEEVFITYAFKCHNYKGIKVGKKEIDACRHHLWGEFKQVQPEVVITCGEKSMNLVCNTKQIMKHRGKVQTINLTDPDLDIRIVPTFSPSYVENVNSKLSVWAADILKAYNLSMGIVDEISSTKMVYCDTIEKVDEAIGYCVGSGFACFDFETPLIDKVMGTFHPDHYATMISLSFQAGSGYAIPLEHKDTPFSKSELKYIFTRLRSEIFENHRVRKLAHNANYDAHILRMYGIKLFGRVDDSMLMHHLCDETKRHGLKELVSMYIPSMANYEDTLKDYKWHEVPIRILAQYAATDTDVTIQLATQFEAELMRDLPSYKIYRNLTMYAFKSLFETESRGMLIDRDYLREAIIETKEMIIKQEAKVNSHTTVVKYAAAVAAEKQELAIEEMSSKLEKWREGHINITKTEENYVANLRALKTGAISAYEGFNIGSPAQVSDILYDHPYGFRINSLERGTGKDILKGLNDKSGFVDGLLLYRSLKKTLSTYLIGIFDRLDAVDRVHTSFKLHGTTSGRLSSANPNLQNIPNIYKLKDQDAIKVTGFVKSSFICPDGSTLIQIDYSQAELRIIAFLAGETNMLQAYADGIDLHALTAANMRLITLEQFYALDPKEQKNWRYRAKAVNFGFIYGMSARGFQEYAKNDYGLILTYEEAVQMRNNFFKAYPKLQEYHEIYKAKGRKFGWVRTLYGRRRRLPDIKHPNDFKRSMDERVAVNSPVQGTAGEFTTFAIGLFRDRLDPRIKLVNTVHDSILFYIPKEVELNSAISEISYTCENLPNDQYFGKDMHGVEMKVDAEASNENWQELKEIT